MAIDPTFSGIKKKDISGGTTQDLEIVSKQGQSSLSKQAQGIGESEGVQSQIDINKSNVALSDLSKNLEGYRVKGYSLDDVGKMGLSEENRKALESLIAYGYSPDEINTLKGQSLLAWSLFPGETWEERQYPLNMEAGNKKLNDIRTLASTLEKAGVDISKVYRDTDSYRVDKYIDDLWARESTREYQPDQKVLDAQNAKMFNAVNDIGKLGFDVTNLTTKVNSLIAERNSLNSAMKDSYDSHNALLQNPKINPWWGVGQAEVDLINKYKDVIRVVTTSGSIYGLPTIFNGVEVIPGEKADKLLELLGTGTYSQDAFAGWGRSRRLQDLFPWIALEGMANSLNWSAAGSGGTVSQGRTVDLGTGLSVSKSGNISIGGVLADKWESKGEVSKGDISPGVWSSVKAWAERGGPSTGEQRTLASKLFGVSTPEAVAALSTLRAETSVTPEGKTIYTGNIFAKYGGQEMQVGQQVSMGKGGVKGDVMTSPITGRVVSEDAQSVISGIAGQPTKEEDGVIRPLTVDEKVRWEQRVQATRDALELLNDATKPQYTDKEQMLYSNPVWNEKTGRTDWVDNTIGEGIPKVDIRYDVNNLANDRSILIVNRDYLVDRESPLADNWISFDTFAQAVGSGQVGQPAVILEAKAKQLESVLKGYEWNKYLSDWSAFLKNPEEGKEPVTTLPPNLLNIADFGQRYGSYYVNDKGDIDFKGIVKASERYEDSLNTGKPVDWVYVLSGSSYKPEPVPATVAQPEPYVSTGVTEIKPEAAVETVDVAPSTKPLYEYGKTYDIDGIKVGMNPSNIVLTMPDGTVLSSIARTEDINGVRLVTAKDSQGNWTTIEDSNKVYAIWSAMDKAERGLQSTAMGNKDVAVTQEVKITSIPMLVGKEQGRKVVEQRGDKVRAIVYDGKGNIISDNMYALDSEQGKFNAGFAQEQVRLGLAKVNITNVQAVIPVKTKRVETVEPSSWFAGGLPKVIMMPYLEGTVSGDSSINTHDVGLDVVNGKVIVSWKTDKPTIGIVQGCYDGGCGNWRDSNLSTDHKIEVDVSGYTSEQLATLHLTTITSTTGDGLKDTSIQWMPTNKAVTLSADTVISAIPDMFAGSVKDVITTMGESKFKGRELTEAENYAKGILWIKVDDNGVVTAMDANRTVVYTIYPDGRQEGHDLHGGNRVCTTTECSIKHAKAIADIRNAVKSAGMDINSYRPSSEVAAIVPPLPVIEKQKKVEPVIIPTLVKAGITPKDIVNNMVAQASITDNKDWKASVLSIVNKYTDNGILNIDKTYQEIIRSNIPIAAPIAKIGLTPSESRRYFSWGITIRPTVNETLFDEAKRVMTTDYNSAKQREAHDKAMWDSLTPEDQARLTPEVTTTEYDRKIITNWEDPKKFISSTKQIGLDSRNYYGLAIEMGKEQDIIDAATRTRQIAESGVLTVPAIESPHRVSTADIVAKKESIVKPKVEYAIAVVNAYKKDKASTLGKPSEEDVYWYNLSQRYLGQDKKTPNYNSIYDVAVGEGRVAVIQTEAEAGGRGVQGVGTLSEIIPIEPQAIPPSGTELNLRPIMGTSTIGDWVGRFVEGHARVVEPQVAKPKLSWDVLEQAARVPVVYKVPKDKGEFADWRDAYYRGRKSINIFYAGKDTNGQDMVIDLEYYQSLRPDEQIVFNELGVVGLNQKRDVALSKLAKYKVGDGRWVGVEAYPREARDNGESASSIRTTLLDSGMFNVDEVNKMMVYVPPDKLLSDREYMALDAKARMEYDTVHSPVVYLLKNVPAKDQSKLPPLSDYYGRPYPGTDIVVDPRSVERMPYYDLAIAGSLDKEHPISTPLSAFLTQFVDMSRLPMAISSVVAGDDIKRKYVVADNVTGVEKNSLVILPSTVSQLYQYKTGAKDYHATGVILDNMSRQIQDFENKEQLYAQVRSLFPRGHEGAQTVAVEATNVILSFMKFFPEIPITIYRSSADIGEGKGAQALARETAFGAGIALWVPSTLAEITKSVEEKKPYEVVGKSLGLAAMLSVGPKTIALQARQARNVLDPATVSRRARSIQVDLVRVTDSKASLAAMMDAVHKAERAMVEASTTGRPVNEYYVGTNSGAIARARLSPNAIVDSTKGWHTTYVTNAQEEIQAYRRNGETILKSPEAIETPTSQYNTGMGTGPAFAFLTGIGPKEEPIIFNTWRSPEKLGRLPEKIPYQIYWDDVPSARSEFLQAWLNGELPEDVWWQVAKGFQARGEKFMSLELENTDPEGTRFIPMPKDLAPEYARYEWVDKDGNVISDNHSRYELDNVRRADKGAYPEVVREIPYTYDVVPGKVLDSEGNIVRREGERIKSYINANESYVDWARSKGIKPLTWLDAYKKEAIAGKQVVEDILSGKYRLNLDVDTGGRERITTSNPFVSVAKTVEITPIKPYKYHWVQKYDASGNPGGVIANLPINLSVYRGRIQGEAVGARYPAVSVYIVDRANKRVLLVHGVDDPMPLEAARGGKGGYPYTVWTNQGGAADWTNPERTALWELGNDQTSHEVNIDVQIPDRWKMIGFYEGTRKDFSQSGAPVFVLDVTGLNVNPNTDGPKNSPFVPQGVKPKWFPVNELTEQNPTPEIDAMRWWSPSSRETVWVDVADYRALQKIADLYPELGIDMSDVRQFRGDSNYSRKMLTDDEDVNFAKRKGMTIDELTKKGEEYQRKVDALATAKSPEIVAFQKGMTYGIPQSVLVGAAQLIGEPQAAKGVGGISRLSLKQEVEMIAKEYGISKDTARKIADMLHTGREEYVKAEGKGEPKASDLVERRRVERIKFRPEVERPIRGEETRKAAERVVTEREVIPVERGQAERDEVRRGVGERVVKEEPIVRGEGVVDRGEVSRGEERRGIGEIERPSGMDRYDYGRGEESRYQRGYGGTERGITERVMPTTTTRVPPLPPPPVLEKYRDTKGNYQGLVAWKQGFVYWVWGPPYGEDNKYAFRRPVEGIQFAKGLRSAYDSIQRRGGYLPPTMRSHFGVVNIEVHTHGAQLRPELSFTREKAKAYKGKRPVAKMPRIIQF